MKARGESIQEMWNKIPDGIDILVTHGPPLGNLKMNYKYFAIMLLNLLLIECTTYSKRK